MNEQQTIEQIKARLNKFIEDIDHVNPDEVRVEDIDEWIGLLDQLEEKVKLVYLSKCHIRCVRVRYRDSRLIFFISCMFNH